MAVAAMSKSPGSNPLAHRMWCSSWSWDHGHTSDSTGGASQSTTVSDDEHVLKNDGIV